MKEIDYNRLASAWENLRLATRDVRARAVVNALRDQGFDIVPHVHVYNLESLPERCVCGAVKPKEDNQCLS